MGRDAFSDRDTVLTCLAELEATHARLEQCSLDGFTGEELVAVLRRREVLARRAPVVDQRIVARLVADGNPGALGATTVAEALTEHLRISRGQARRRVTEAAQLGPRTSLTGQPLPPLLPALAAAQAAGQIGPEHLDIARKAYAKIPAAVPADLRATAEADLAAMATRFGPAAFAKLAEHLLTVLDPDGDVTDRDRRAQRRARLGRQRPDGMSTLHALITPELRATLEPIFAKLAAPGMCNPADEHPCLTGSPTETHILADDRTPDQRHHDALTAMSRALLACGDLGQLNGLPVTVIVTTTLAELHTAAGEPEPAASATTTAAPQRKPLTGKALTAGGTILPISDLLRMASHAYHYLTIFDDTTGRPLWLGRTKRLATADQRIVLHARDHGCTRPGCTTAGYHTQVHHLRDWAHDGPTDINNLALACGPDNRMATTENWTTQLNNTGRVEWIPPPPLERGQPRTNPYHFIEDLIDYHHTNTAPPPPGSPPHTNSEPVSDPNPGSTDLDTPNDPLPEPDYFWDDGPLPGEPGYDELLEAHHRAYETMDLQALDPDYEHLPWVYT
ncbi:HNH endonuclease signature motif containing protein [[Mycobacterium] wendilense]|uniref:HNH endonuclease signature motif containing protein n=1 Tax=[Mycobacterium] wendilense TaxID=3064284 RepID=A0ABN9P6L7_9MYCO|nr:HNH endonuclease signature motif containing protein [Mycolicibacterium sp. MU0050]CAJ1585746.1 HNH endonuclease signature motif containing protein [Mycolicibacterium sp. MU0050]